MMFKVMVWLKAKIDALNAKVDALLDEWEKRL